MDINKWYAGGRREEEVWKEREREGNPNKEAISRFMWRTLRRRKQRWGGSGWSQRRGHDAEQPVSARPGARPRPPQAPRPFLRFVACERDGVAARKGSGTGVGSRRSVSKILATLVAQGFGWCFACRVGIASGPRLRLGVALRNLTDMLRIFFASRSSSSPSSSPSYSSSSPHYSAISCCARL